MNRFKFYRMERQLTQVELSVAASIPRYKISLIEQGLICPEPDERERLSAILGADFSDEARDVVSVESSPPAHR